MKVYKKPTYKLVMIPSWSNDLYSYKLAVFKALFNRICTHTTKWSDMKNELNYILEPGRKYRYSNKTILGIWSKISSSLMNPPPKLMGNLQTYDNCKYIDLP